MTEPVDEPTKLDELQSEVDLPEYPDDAPELLPYLRLSRRRRADFMRQFALIAPALDALQQDDDVPAPTVTAPKAEWAAFARKMGVKVTSKMTRDDIVAAVGRAPKYIKQLSDRAALTQDVLADVEDLLRASASDQDAFDEWALQAKDDELFALFKAFMARTRPGEALSSAS